LLTHFQADDSSYCDDRYSKCTSARVEIESIYFDADSLTLPCGRPGWEKLPHGQPAAHVYGRHLVGPHMIGAPHRSK
jgi:hypothetical protein